MPVVVCSAAWYAVRRIEPGHLGTGVGLLLKPFGLDDVLREVRVMTERGARWSQAGAAPVGKTVCVG